MNGSNKKSLSEYNGYASFNKVYDNKNVAFGLQGETPYIDLLNKFKLIHEGPSVSNAPPSVSNAPVSNAQPSVSNAPVSDVQPSVNNAEPSTINAPVSDVQPLESNAQPVYEGFDNRPCGLGTANGIGCKDHILNNQLTPLRNKFNEIDQKQIRASNRSVSIQENVREIRNNIRNMKRDGQNDKYEFLGIWNEPKTIANGIKEDSKTLMETQANVFVLSTLACASMVVAAIMISS